MPFGGLLTGGLIAGGGAASIIGGKNAANAQQNIATAQLNEQQSERGYAMQAAQPTAEQLQAMQNQLQDYQSTYNMQNAQLQSDIGVQGAINPQLQALLNGGQAPAMQPYQNMVNNQQQQMQAQLERQLGPGWQTTTAGQQAMQQFGLQSAAQGSQIQQQYLGQMLGASQGFGGMIGQQINQNAGSLAALNQGSFNMSNQMQQNMISASEGTSLTPFSGAGSVAALGMGNMIGQMGGSAMGMGSNLAGMATMAQMYRPQNQQTQTPTGEPTDNSLVGTSPNTGASLLS